MTNGVVDIKHWAAHPVGKACVVTQSASIIDVPADAKGVEMSLKAPRFVSRPAR